MDYMLMYQESPTDFAQRADAAAAPVYWAAWNAYIGAMAGAGIIVSGAGLQSPHASTVVRVRDGNRQVQDGPYADTHDHLGGFFVIRADSLDAALEWAARAPCAGTGAVEVRPVLPMSPPPGA